MNCGKGRVKARPLFQNESYENVSKFRHIFFSRNNVLIMNKEGIWAQYIQSRLLDTRALLLLSFSTDGSKIQEKGK